MKQGLKRFSAILMFCSLTAVCSSCFTQSFLVGGGAKGAQEEIAQSWYIVYGLASLSNTNISAMAKGANSYTVTTQRTFLDGLLGGILLSGFIAPETVIVRR